MKGVKKIIALVLSLAMIISLNVTTTFVGTIKAETQPFVITSPVGWSLKPAGYIDIEWSEALKGEVKDYSVYIDGKLAATTKEKSYEFYTTKVCYHEAYVTANYNNGSSETTAKVMFGVTKKGVCVADDMGRNFNPATVGAAWYYNWGKRPFSYAAYKNLEYIPMIWGYQSAASIASDCKKFESQGYKSVLAFNEPEPFEWLPQSQIEVQDALKVWPGFMNTSLRVSSPATALNPVWENKPGQWWHDFMEGINADVNLGFDFVAVHIYYDNYASAKAGYDMLELVDEIYALCKKPIWLTEYAPAKNVSKTGTAEFVKITTQGFTDRSYIERFSYFNFNPNPPKPYEGDSSNAALWYYEDGRLTDAGKNYANYGNPTKDYKGNDLFSNNDEQVTTKPIVTKPTDVKKPAKAAIKSAKNIKKRKIKLTLKKIKRIKGYQIRWSDNKKYRGYWQKNIKKRTYIIKKLDKKTKYYIKVRAYVLNGKKKVYGRWSKTKRVLVKK